MKNRVFPSPCGVLVLKYHHGHEGNNVHKRGFRPLAGFWFLNFLSVWMAGFVFNGFRPLAGFWFLNPSEWQHGADSAWFPSPCGVLVLKL